MGPRLSPIRGCIQPARLEVTDSSPPDPITRIPTRLWTRPQGRVQSFGSQTQRNIVAKAKTHSADSITSTLLSLLIGSAVAVT